MNPRHSSTQLALDFQPGLTERFDSLHACVSSCAHSNKKPLKSIAMDMDMSPSELSRKLAFNPDDVRRLTVGDLESFIEATGDTTPIIYLAQKFCVDSDFRRREALAALAEMAPQIQALLKAAKS